MKYMHLDGSFGSSVAEKAGHNLSMSYVANAPIRNDRTISHPSPIDQGRILIGAALDCHWTDRHSKFAIHGDEAERTGRS